MATEGPRGEFLYPGKNGIETSVALVDVLSGFSGRRRTMERKTVGMAYTAEDAAKHRRAIVWLNETLDKLGLGDRKFPLEERGEP
jgi:hypothetical protein